MTVTDYDSNDTALAKVKAGGHGFDIVVPSANYVPIFVEQGLLMETRPDQMENFKQHRPAMDRRGVGPRPPLHGALAVGHDRHRGQHRGL